MSDFLTRLLLCVLLAWPLSGAMAGQTADAPTLYPDPERTPGAVTTVDREVVCVPGYSIALRKKEGPTPREKCAIYRSYGLSCQQPRGRYEIDHLIPMKIGGSAGDPKNLWPQPAPYWRQKDRLEFYLIHEVCETRSLTPAEAQDLIRTDWRKTYREMPARWRGGK